MRIRTIIWFALALLLWLPTAPSPAGATVASAPSGTVQPSSGPPETLFTFTASGYRSTERIFLWLNTPDGSPRSLDKQILADSQGAATWTWQTWAGITSGTWTMVAQGQYSRHITVTRVFIEGPVPQPTGVPVQSATPPSGPPGATFTITAGGYYPDEQIDTWVNTPAGQPRAAPAYVFASKQGQASWQWTAPTDAAPGVWSVVGRGRASMYERVIRVLIVAR